MTKDSKRYLGKYKHNEEVHAYSKANTVFLGGEDGNTYK